MRVGSAVSFLRPGFSETSISLVGGGEDRKTMTKGKEEEEKKEGRRGKGKGVNCTEISCRGA